MREITDKEKEIIEKIYNNDPEKEHYSLEEYCEIISNFLPEESYIFEKDDSYDKSVNFVFRHPDSICTDTKGRQTPILGLYFKIEIKHTGFYITGIRSVYTYEQALHKYKHSHLTREDLDCWSDICFGNVNIIKNSFIKTFVLFMSIKDVFVENESSDTNPFMRIEDINKPKNTLAVPLNHKFSLSFSDIEIEERIIQNRLIPFAKLTESKIEEVYAVDKVYEIDGNYYQVEGIDDDNTFENLFFRINDRIINITILEKEKKDTNEITTIPNPLTLEQLQAKAQYLLYELNNI